MKTHLKLRRRAAFTYCGLNTWLNKGVRWQVHVHGQRVDDLCATCAKVARHHAGPSDRSAAGVEDMVEQFSR